MHTLSELLRNALCNKTRQIPLTEILKSSFVNFFFRKLLFCFDLLVCAQSEFCCFVLFCFVLMATTGEGETMRH